VAALDPDGVLAAFNRARVLIAADIHVARILARLGGDPDELVALAVALAVRAPRVGHVLVDLATVQATVVAATGKDEDEGVDLGALPWPEPEAWAHLVSRSPLVETADLRLGHGLPGDSTALDRTPGARPLRLAGSALYLDRYWRDEVRVADGITARAGAAAKAVDEDLLAEGLARLFPDDPGGPQSRAAAVAVRRLLSVVVGGPGTGKTTTVARLLSLLDEQATAAGDPPLRVALAAPTGKAAARMAEAVHNEARRLGIATAARARLLALEASTVHRLLGRHPAGANRFRHDRNDRLPHDVVVVDETSMMSLSLMARLVEAVRPEARLVLIGDHGQLASVEAGAVLADIVGPAAEGSHTATSRHNPLGKCITVLRANHRFSGPLAELANAVRSGDGEAVIKTLAMQRTADTAGPVGRACEGDHLRRSSEASQADPEARSLSSICWLDVELADCAEDWFLLPALEPVRLAVLRAGGLLFEAAAAGDGPAALGALGRLRLLCAHRDGSAGASTWNVRAQQWLAATDPPVLAGAGYTEMGWYLGRPVIVTENDYSLGLFNGDTGATIKREDGGLSVVFQRGSALVAVSPSRLAAVETAFAMTAHRAQGSEFDEVVVLLPGALSRVLTRELFYTAVTRARRRVTVVGTEATVRRAVERPVARASRLAARLWGGPGLLS
jgi:exodeoxyribonuclease V alpha subunit